MTSPGDAKDAPSSGAIPLPRTHIPRTRSELQLEDDRRAYEWREGVVYNRIVSGMLLRSGRHPEIGRSARNVVQTQAGPVPTGEDEIAAAGERARLGSVGSSGGSSSGGGSDGDDEWLLYDSPSGREDGAASGDAGPAWEFQRALGCRPPFHAGDDDAIFELDL